jgi:hypothetical protein
LFFLPTGLFVFCPMVFFLALLCFSIHCLVFFAH